MEGGGTKYEEHPHPSSVGEPKSVDPRLLEHTQEGSENNESAPGLKEWHGKQSKWNFLGMVERPFVKMNFWWNSYFCTNRNCLR